ncbi:hypothetical protein AB0I10_11845 [Streptomyces sp. NPDC050636]|uniref:hypothetical protein n=1 Tax=Streptomyces sp. NPDC050636 TaxID=3154510 RepID=UPI00342D60A2
MVNGMANMANDEPVSAVDRTRDQVRQRWDAWQAPGGDNVIVFADGSLSLMDYPLDGSSSSSSSSSSSEILRATAWTVEDWIDVDTVLAQHAYAGSRAFAGGAAAHGSIGWVALTRDDDDRTLEWLAVCPWSDPFAEVTLDGSTLTAVTTSGSVWRFPRDRPQRVAIGGPGSAGTSVNAP